MKLPGPRPKGAAWGHTAFQVLGLWSSNPGPTRKGSSRAIPPCQRPPPPSVTNHVQAAPPACSEGEAGDGVCCTGHSCSRNSRVPHPADQSLRYTRHRTRLSTPSRTRAAETVPAARTAYATRISRSEASVATAQGQACREPGCPGDPRTVGAGCGANTGFTLSRWTDGHAAVFPSSATTLPPMVPGAPTWPDRPRVASGATAYSEDRQLGGWRSRVERSRCSPEPGPKPSHSGSRPKVPITTAGKPPPGRACVTQPARDGEQLTKGTSKMEIWLSKINFYM